MEALKRRVARLCFLDTTPTEGAPSLRSLQGWELRTHASDGLEVRVGTHPFAKNAKGWGSLADTLHAESSRVGHPPLRLSGQYEAARLGHKDTATQLFRILIRASEGAFGPSQWRTRKANARDAISLPPTLRKVREGWGTPFMSVRQRAGHPPRRSWYPPFAKNAKNGAPTYFVLHARSKAWATRHFISCCY
jgi:hypothetical protein